MTSPRDRLLLTAKRRYATVDTPWGLFTIQSITEAERMAIQFDAIDDDGNVKKDTQRLINAAFIQLCLVEEVDGKYTQVFLKEETIQIAACDAYATRMIMNRIEKHCGLGDDEKTIKGMEKNLNGTGDDDSTTNSPTDAAELMSTSS